MKEGYKITFSLSSGYKGNGPEYSFAFAEEVIEKWMEKRISEKKPVVNGMLIAGTLFFPSNGRREDGKTVSMANSAIYQGNILSTNDKNIKEITETLESLALDLKTELQQEKVFIILNDRDWFI